MEAGQTDSQKEIQKLHAICSVLSQRLDKIESNEADPVTNENPGFAYIQTMVNRRAQEIDKKVTAILQELRTILGYQENQLRMSIMEKIIHIIVACKNSSNPSSVYKQHYAELAWQINQLRDGLSTFNTVLNFMLSCLVICSLIGIVLLCLSGTWEKNKQENGSYFTFFKFGDVQKVQSEIAKFTKALEF